MKRITLIVLLGVLSSCSTTMMTKQKKQNNKQVEQKIGGDRDDNGCIRSAGYIWSQIKKGCIRPFEMGIQLPSIKTSKSVAYILIDNDRAEVIAAETKDPILLKKTSEGEWENQNWKLTYKNNSYSLSMNNNLLYKK